MGLVPPEDANRKEKAMGGMGESWTGRFNSLLTA